MTVSHRPQGKAMAPIVHTLPSKRTMRRRELRRMHKMNDLKFVPSTRRFGEAERQAIEAHMTAWADCVIAEREKQRKVY